MQIAACTDHGLPAKQPERPGDNHVASESIPAQPAKEKGAQVFDNLDSSQQAVRRMDAHDPASLHHRSIDGANRAARRHHRIGLDERADDPLKRVRFNQSIGVDGAYKFVRRDVQSDIQ